MKGSQFLYSLLLMTLVSMPLVAYAQNDLGEDRPTEAPTSPKQRFTTTRKQAPEDEDSAQQSGGDSDSWGASSDGEDKNASAPEKPAPNKKGSTGATVATDGAIVYDKPNQDANVIGMLPQNQKIRVSRGMTKGEIKFHKVKVSQKIGYIADIDITLDEAAAAQAAMQKKNSKKNKNGKQASKDKSKKNKPRKVKEREPMFYTRFVGLLFGESQYKEGINGVDATTTLTTYGLKITGPDVVINGPVMDLNIALHYGAPSYYGPLAVPSPSGYLIFTDLLMMLPFVQNFNSMLYVEAGPLLVYSSFKVLNAGHSQDLTQLNLGGSLVLGWGYRIEDIALRLEAKYMIEKQSYSAIQLAVQTGF